jgi:hypothetical protein
MADADKPVDLEDLLGGEAVEVPEEDKHPILSPDQVRAARAEARQRVEAARVKSAQKALIDEETLRLEREEGFTTGAKQNDEMVRITLDLAPFQASSTKQSGLTLNFKTYFHNCTYTVPRHVANTLREMQAQGWRHQHEIEGKSLTEHYQRAEEPSISPTGIKSPFAGARAARVTA